MSRAYYVECSTFVAVFTPHYQEQATRRQASPIGPAMLERMWAVGIEDTCTGFRWGEGYVYYRSIWNLKRERWELELISYTPGNRFHTDKLNFAVEVYP